MTADFLYHVTRGGHHAGWVRATSQYAALVSYSRAFGVSITTLTATKADHDPVRAY